jgi:hypothetical protein
MDLSKQLDRRLVSVKKVLAMNYKITINNMKNILSDVWILESDEQQRACDIVNMLYE